MAGASSPLARAFGERFSGAGDALLTNVQIIGSIDAYKGSLDSLKITGDLTASSTGAVKSENYASGSAGWNVDGDGTAELNNVSIRGSVNAATIEGSTFGTTSGDGLTRAEIEGGYVEFHKRAVDTDPWSFRGEIRAITAGLQIQGPLPSQVFTISEAATQVFQFRANVANPNYVVSINNSGGGNQMLQLQNGGVERVKFDDITDGGSINLNSRGRFVCATGPLMRVKNNGDTGHIEITASAFTVASTQTVKTNIADADLNELLAILKAAPVKTFEYATEDASPGPHCGIMAEDVPDLIHGDSGAGLNLADQIGLLWAIAQKLVEEAGL